MATERKIKSEKGTLSLTLSQNTVLVVVPHRHLNHPRIQGKRTKVICPCSRSVCGTDVSPLTSRSPLWLARIGPSTNRRERAFEVTLPTTSTHWRSVDCALRTNLVCERKRTSNGYAATLSTRGACSTDGASGWDASPQCSIPYRGNVHVVLSEREGRCPNDRGSQRCARSAC